MWNVMTVTVAAYGITVIIVSSVIFIKNKQIFEEQKRWTYDKLQEISEKHRAQFYEEIRRKKIEEREQHELNNSIKHQECKDLVALFEAKEEFIYDMLNKNFHFDKNGITFKRYDYIIKSCEKVFMERIKVADNPIIRSGDPDLYRELIVFCKELLRSIDKLAVELAKYDLQEYDDSIIKDLNSLTNDVKKYYNEW